MKLSEKIYELRKRGGMSQEELAEKLMVSRQSVSRWENGTALPDAANLAQLARLFNVTADCLINDEYLSDADLPIVKSTKTRANRRLIGLCAALAGLFGNLVIFILSRFIAVEVPVVTYDGSGGKLYTWNGMTDYSFRYFVQEHNLELAAALLALLTAAGLLAALADGKKLRALADRLRAVKRSL